MPIWRGLTHISEWVTGLSKLTLQPSCQANCKNQKHQGALLLMAKLVKWKRNKHWVLKDPQNGLWCVKLAPLRSDLWQFRQHIPESPLSLSLSLPWWHRLNSHLSKTLCLLPILAQQSSTRPELNESLMMLWHHSSGQNSSLAELRGLRNDTKLLSFTSDSTREG